MAANKPNLFQALLPIAVLIVLLMLNVYVFDDDASYGSNQIALLLAAGVAAVIGFSLGIKWIKMREGVIKAISSTMTSIIILLLIGALAGTWLLSGIIPAMVYYGLQILNPTIFLFATVVICSVVSLGTGSSWSTVATVGIALLGIGEAMGFDEGLIAGAVISGAYFGDKISPLSDTTNLAPAMAGTDLFTHIRHMTWTTVPAIVITLIIFLFIGFNYDPSGSSGEMDQILSLIQEKFNITPFLFLAPVIVVFMIVKKAPPIPSLLTGTLLGGIFAVIFQPDAVMEVGSETRLISEVRLEGDHKDIQYRWTTENGDELPEAVSMSDDGTSLDMAIPGSYTLAISNDYGLNGTAEIIVPEYNTDISAGNEFPVYSGDEKIGTVVINAERSTYAYSAYKAFVNAMSVPISIETGNENVNKLLQQDGMEGMLNTIWLILCAMIFGGIMEMAGLLARISDAIMQLAYNTGSLIAATAGTCMFFNVTASDQYLAIVVPGRMFQDAYRKRGLKPENLSRALEDSGTVTSVLVPWNTCGATQASVLGVATLTYLPFCFFNLLSPVISVLYGIIGFKIPHLTEEEMKANVKASAESH
jgi:NhaC family Na+:H+ antiporter